MVRRLFYSFHYLPDCSRAGQVRNMGVVEGNASATDNDWEEVKRGGDRSIQRWIDGQLAGKSCTAVLIGANTAGRKWIKYEIEKSWNEGKGVFGVYIHNLKDLRGMVSPRGANPFAEFTIKNTPFSSIVRAYDPPGYDSKMVYAHIKANMSSWIEEAIAIRAKY